MPTIDANKPFINITSLNEALETVVAGAAGRKMTNDKPENHAAATFLQATKWMLVDLSKAAIENRLLERVIELQDAHTAILDHLSNSLGPRH